MPRPLIPMSDLDLAEFIADAYASRQAGLGEAGVFSMYCKERNYSRLQIRQLLTLHQPTIDALADYISENTMQWALGLLPQQEEAQRGS